MQLKKVLAAGLTGAVLATLAAAPVRADDMAPKSLGRVHLLLGGPPWATASFLPFAVALKNGYWKEQGLTVEIAGIQGQSTAAQALITGRADVAAAGPETALQAASSGKPINIQSFYTWNRKATWTIAVPADSKYHTLADLKGATIGVATVGKADASAARVLLSAAQGVDESDIKILPVGVGAQALEALKRGDVQAYSDGDASAAQIDALGLKLRAIPLPEEYQKASDTTFAATPEYIKTHRAQLVAFGRGFSEAVAFCKYNLDACVKQFWAQYPTAKPPNADKDFEAAAAPFLAVGRTRIPKYYADDGKWGETRLDAWLEVAKVLHFDHVDKTELKKYINNDLVADMSNFDEAKIAQQAKDFGD